MPEKTLPFWGELNLYITMMIFGLVLFASKLVGNEPINPKRLTGELILSFVGAALFHALGLMKGLTGPEYWVLIFLAALGGLRSVEHIIRLFIALKKISL